MVDQVPDIPSQEESLDDHISYQACTRLEQFDQETTDAINEAVPPLPPHVVEFRKKAHDDAFNAASPFPTATLATTSKVRKIKARWMSRPQWMLNLKRWALMRSLKSDATKQSPTKETFVREIAFEVVDGKTKIIYCHGIAMIDPWCPYNVISRKFAKNFYDGLDSAIATPLFDTLNGSVNAIRKIRARWYCKENLEVEEPRVKCDPTMEESDFHIMEDGCRFDVIIGVKDIRRFGLLVTDRPLAAPGFRSLPPPINVQSGQNDQAVAELARQQEEDEMRRDQELKAHADAYAHAHAHAYAHSYAEGQAAAYVHPQARAQAYSQAYTPTYLQVHAQARQCYIQAHAQA
ncbi:hypothetical protein K469DRAFT_186728 [Zopfia rhizophila CBS 207.26]|uniref:Uncharacterized protein n=1 Tax=Zopfia rhizophila CBS 207.26 TaxID=1314779 RepID=A0A6A6EQM1_9PEZI|nr:hypothetical protein K469DRAFT_186728 [Zopfia rhizophila CBS 207.26]